MATNEILQFAETDTGTNLLTQAEYLADAQRPIGNQPGVARSKLVNKALRQSSLIAAAVAQFIADNQTNNVVDTAAPADSLTGSKLPCARSASRLRRPVVRQMPSRLTSRRMSL